MSKPTSPNAATRFASMISEAESLSGDERRDAVRKIATGFLSKYAAEHVASGGPLADELAAHLPANDSASKHDPHAEARAILTAPKTNTAPKPTVTPTKPSRDSRPPLGPQPRRWNAAPIEATPYDGPEAADSAIAKAKSEDVKKIAVKIGSSLDHLTIDDTTAEALLKRLKDKSGVTLAKLRAEMALGRKSETTEYQRWAEEKERRRLEDWNVVSGFSFLPDGYVANPNGRFERREVFGKEVKFDPICHIFNVVGKTYNQEESDSGLVIAFAFNGNRKEVTLYQEHIQGDKKALCSHLGKEGLSIYAGPDEFGRFLLFIMDKVEREIVTFDKPGWHEIGGEDSKLIFVSPTGEVIGAEDDESREYRLKQGVGFKLGDPPGDLETWKAINAEMAEENPHWTGGPVFGLTGVVLQAAKLDSCGINLSGHSSYGKTTTQRQAASAWTHTEDKTKPGLLRVAKTTINAAENSAEAATGTALLLDELENIQDKRTLGQFIMTFAGGQGKARQGKAGELRRTASWATFYVLSCEDPARKLVQEGGGKWLAGHTARLVDFDCNDAKKIDAAKVQAWRTGLEENWGHAGPTFVRRGLEAGVFDGEELQKRIIARAKQIAGGGNPVLGRAAQVFAAVAVTAEIAAELDVITPEHAARIPAALDHFWKLFAESHDAAASDPRGEAVEHLVTALNARRGVDVLPTEPPLDRDGNERQRHREAVAWYKDDTVFIRADKFEELAKARISGAAVRKHLEALKALSREQADRQVSRNVPDVGAVNHYRLNGEMLGFNADFAEEAPPVKRGGPERTA